MDELQRWIDFDPPRRRYELQWTGSKFEVRVWDTAVDGICEFEGNGSGASVTFAAVQAIVDYAANSEPEGA